MNTNFPFIPDIQARKKLAAKLNLVFSENMQDWEYEISDSNRIQDFILEYDKSDLSPSEKLSLMEIILDSANDLLLEKRRAEFNTLIPIINDRLNRNDGLHKATINYWKNNDFEISDELKV